ncbi:hypothetical protein [Terasakiella sp.]|uniref:hypothetical protein n=1 Tax=Terasakiella sp. TaxID=2034861 RepID=UPI003AFF8350
MSVISKKQMINGVACAVLVGAMSAAVVPSVQAASVSGAFEVAGNPCAANPCAAKNPVQRTLARLKTRVLRKTRAQQRILVQPILVRLRTLALLKRKCNPPAFIAQITLYKLKMPQLDYAGAFFFLGEAWSNISHA